MNTTTNDFTTIVLNRSPLVDLRAPVEFENGSFMNAVNLPLMTNEERHLVGTCYKHQGHDAAVQLGHTLVSGTVKEERIHQWINFLHIHPDALLFCFRGGMRSQIAQQWIYETVGIEVPRLEGGYKAFRQYLLNAMEPEALNFQSLILTGSTGSGKTVLLQTMENAVDLEGLANHRGSSFGGNPSMQPPQIAFENNLAYRLIQQQNRGFTHLLFEDESRNIGRSYLPKTLFETIKGGQYVLLHVDLEDRIQHIHEEYIHQLQYEYQVAYGPVLGMEQWKSSMESSLYRIKKRLGDEVHRMILTSLLDGFYQQVEHDDDSYHRAWIRMLLETYYDPMYQYQIEKKMDRIVFQGSYSEVSAYLKTKAISA
jgi:tRNA 2-selenouridine synthase